MLASAPDLRRNRLLARLPSGERNALAEHVAVVEHGFKAVLLEPGDALEAAYFPLSGLFSLVQVLEQGQTIEVATVGYEGMLGVSGFLGSDTADAKVVCQIAGTSLRLPTGMLRSLAGAAPHLRQALGRYTNALLFQIARGSACNRAHSLDQRAARWILSTQDHVDTDEFPLTHELLAQMLGVRRAGVSEAAARLRAAGLISYSLGRVRVTDRAGLEAAACGCYEVIAQALHRTFIDEQ